MLYPRDMYNENMRMETGGAVTLLTTTRSLSNDKGFSMIEVLIATIIMVVMMTGGLAMIEATGNGQLYAQRSTRASHLALEKLEALKTLPFLDPDIAATVAPCPATVANRRQANPTTAPDSLIFTRYYCVTDLPGGTARQVDMYVQHPAFSTTKTMRMSTIMARVQP